MEPGDLVCYRDFVRNIDEQFFDQTFKTSANFSEIRPKINEEETDLALRIKEEFIKFRLANRLEPKQFFENWDKLNRLKVSPKQFRQVLATLGFELTAVQNEAICKLYTTDDGQEVKYLEFLEDTKPYDYKYMTEIKDVPRRGTGERPPIPENVEAVLKNIQRTTKINRLRFKDYFKDFDPLNKGIIRKNKFRGVVFQTLK